MGGGVKWGRGEIWLPSPNPQVGWGFHYFFLTFRLLQLSFELTIIKFIFDITEESNYHTEFN